MGLCPCPRSCWMAIVVMPIIAFIGVRTSCDMRARKLLLASFASLATSRGVRKLLLVQESRLSGR